MKIGILTLPLHTNYGGILQAYALQEVLQRMGHEVFVFDQDNYIQRSFFRQCISYLKYIVERFLLGRDVHFFTQSDLLHHIKEREEREHFTRFFVKKYIHIYIVKNLINDVPKGVDAIIVGSDQVWRHYYFTGSYHCGIENAFLKFAKKWKIKRVSYAASFGTDNWEYTNKETAECSRLLKHFDAVGVREASAVGICKDKLEYDNAVHVLDPTMLLTKEDYMKLVGFANTPKSKGNLFCYVLDESEEKSVIINHVAKDRNLSPFTVFSNVGDLPSLETKRIQPPVEQWLRGFMEAELVVTDSFHACVFCIIFDKPFLVVGNMERGMARFESLLAMFNLKEHLVCNIKEYKSEYDYVINQDAYGLLDALRKESMLFLNNVL